MIEQLTDYLINLPSPGTSPMHAALSTAGMLAELGPTVTKVNLIDTRDTDGNPPYCRFYDTGEVQTVVTFITGPNRIWIEAIAMQVECAAYGPTPGIAGARADYLRLAVEGKLQSLKSSILGGAITARSDLGGTASTDTIEQIFINGGKPAKPPQGPGEDVDNPHWTVTRVLRVDVWVRRARMA